MARKERLTVTVDADLFGERVATERRREALRAAIALCEAEFGEIGSEEVAAQERADRRAALVVRGATAGGGR